MHPVMHITIILTWLILCTKPDQFINKSKLIDSLIITSELQTYFKNHTRLREYRIKKLKTSPLANRRKLEVDKVQKYASPTEYSESICPSIRCFVIHNYTSNQMMFDCTNETDDNLRHETDSVKLINIDCRLWRIPTSSGDYLHNNIHFEINQGHGFDLKINIQPSVSEQSDRTGISDERNSIKRLHIQHLRPGVFEWIIERVRLSLNMLLSPVHLTVSFIYFSRLGRQDLGNLHTRSQVTRLNLWNPFNLDEDSFMPTELKSPISSYFRLTITCDMDNQEVPFKRLWFAWKQWQIRWNHCPTQFVCRNWYSRYTVCTIGSVDQNDRTSESQTTMTTFMPTYFIIPKQRHQITSRLGLQILHDNQCQSEPDLNDPLDDLKLDHKRKCWEPGVYMPINVPKLILTTASHKRNNMDSPAPKLNTSNVDQHIDLFADEVIDTHNHKASKIDENTPSSLPHTKTNKRASQTVSPKMLLTTKSSVVSSRSPSFTLDEKQEESIKQHNQRQQLLNPVPNAGEHQTQPIIQLTYGLILLAVINITVIFGFLLFLWCICKRMDIRLSANFSDLKTPKQYTDHSSNLRIDALNDSRMMTHFDPLTTSNHQALHASTPVLHKYRRSTYLSDVDPVSDDFDSSPITANRPHTQYNQSFISSRNMFASTGRLWNNSMQAFPSLEQNRYLLGTSLNAFPSHDPYRPQPQENLTYNTTDTNTTITSVPRPRPRSIDRKLNLYPVSSGENLDNYRQRRSRWRRTRADSRSRRRHSRSNRMNFVTKPTKRPHTLVFDNDELVDINWPESLKGSLNKVY